MYLLESGIEESVVAVALLRCIYQSLGVQPHLVVGMVMYRELPFSSQPRSQNTDFDWRSCHHCTNLHWPVVSNR